MKLILELLPLLVVIFLSHQVSRLWIIFYDDLFTIYEGTWRMFSIICNVCCKLIYGSFWCIICWVYRQQNARHWALKDVLLIIVNLNFLKLLLIWLWTRLRLLNRTRTNSLLLLKLKLLLFQLILLIISHFLHLLTIYKFWCFTRVNIYIIIYHFMSTL